MLEHRVRVRLRIHLTTSSALISYYTITSRSNAFTLTHHDTRRSTLKSDYRAILRRGAVDKLPTSAGMVPIVKPKKLSPRGIFAPLLPLFFRKPKHPQQMLKGDPKTMTVPWDADEIFYYIKRKEKKFKASIMSMYEDGNTSGPQRPRDATWCVATGCFVPRTQTRATHIFPPALGSSIIEFIGGTREVWSPVNGLMLPKPVQAALDAWALMIVPSDPIELFRRCELGLKFRVMDRQHPAMSEALYRQEKPFALPEVTTGDLDEIQLVFGNAYRPRTTFLYFQSCCAVWKKTYLDNPDCDDEADFAARFVSEISQYWHPDYVKKSKVTDVFVFKYKDASYIPPESTKSYKDIRFRRIKGYHKGAIEPTPSGIPSDV